jgi:hypothetical protein
MTTLADQFVSGLTAWRENRGGGRSGMQSILNCINNRAAKRGTSPYIECIRPLQFSSITAKGDPELNLWPAAGDPLFAEALAMAAEPDLADITGGATLYYAPRGISSTKTFTMPNGQTVKFPEDWNEQAVKFTVEIEDQLFFQQV